MEENRVNLTKDKKNVDKKAVIFKSIIEAIKYWGISVGIVFAIPFTLMGLVALYDYMGQYALIIGLGLVLAISAIICCVINIKDAEKQLHSKENVDTSEVDTKAEKGI